MAERLVIEINGKIAGFQKSLKDAKKETESFERATAKIAKVSAIAFTGLTASIVGLTNQARKMEDMTTQFRVLTGSAEKATALMKDLTEFSAKTPFQLEGINKAASQLLGFGFEAEQIKPKLKEIGDVAAAINKPISEVGFIFGQVAAAGKLTGERLLQFQERAIPIGPAIAKTMGVAEGSVRDLVSQGKVSFEIFEQAFASLSEKGGFAFEGMSQRSETLSGLISTLKDNISLLAADIGQQFLPEFKKATESLIKGIQFLKDNPEFTKLTAAVIAASTAFSGFVVVVNASATALIKFRAIAVATAAPLTALASALAPILAVGGALAGVVVGLKKVAETNAERALNRSLQDINKELSELKRKKDIINEAAEKDSNYKKLVEKEIEKIDDQIRKLDELKKARQLADPDFGTGKMLLRPEVDGSVDPLAGVNQDLFGDSANIVSPLAPNPEATEEAFKKSREKSLEQREIDLGIKSEQEEEDLERQIVLDQLKDDQDLARINKQIENEEDKEKRLKLIQDRRDLIEQKRDKMRLKQQFISNKERLQMDYETNKQLVDGATTLASTLVSVSGASAKQQFLIQRSLGIVQTLINAYMAKGLAEATVPPPAGEILGANRLTQGLIASGIIAAQTGIQYTAMAEGGLVSGGIRGVDSVPILGQQGELMSPAQNFEEVIGSVRAKREAEKLVGDREEYATEDFFEDDKPDILVGIKEEFVEYIELEIVRRRGIGISHI